MWAQQNQGFRIGWNNSHGLDTPRNYHTSTISLPFFQMLLIFWKSGRETSKYHPGWIILILMAHGEIEMSGIMDQKFKGKKSGLWTMHICAKKPATSTPTWNPW